jgi:phage repressor protein C with HTH and peptisase S24 domain
LVVSGLVLVSVAQESIPMLKHPDIWRAIDELAAQYGFSPSGLAREAGLDATTFNLSKRSADGGKKRWPSTESIAKILEVTGASIMEFAALVAKTNFRDSIPTIAWSIAAKAGHFDANGHCVGKAWTPQPIPGTNDENAFGIAVNNKALEPAYRQGTLLVACPGARLQKGDRAAVVTADGALTIREVLKVGGRSYELAPFPAGSKGGKQTINMSELRMLAKIALVVE